MSQPQIRYPVGDPRLAEWNRNIERAIGDASSPLDTRLSAVEGELMALTESAEIMAEALVSMERLTVVMAAAAQAQTDLLARIEALSRGRPDPRPSEEGSALIREFLGKETR